MKRDLFEPDHESARRLEQLLECAPDAIFEFDGEGRIVLLNHMAEQLFGYRREELLGKTVEQLVPEALQDTHKAHRAHYGNQPLTRPMGSGLRLEARRKDGSLFPVEISLSPLHSKAGVSVTAIVRDITQRQQIEEQLRVVQQKYIQELESRARQSEQANKLKTEFLASMSHELRSPLHTILGFTDLLATETAGPLSEKQRRFLTHIHTDSEHLLNLINDLLDLSKIEAGRLELCREVFPIETAVEDVLSSIRPSATAKSVELQTHVSLQAGVFADRLRVKQILQNLLTNAVKYTAGGGKIRIQAVPNKDFAEISVIDTGVGIPEEQQALVFDKFYQVRSAANHAREGTGLGLAITRRLVEQHGGTIWLKSTPGTGSCFTFTLPYE